MRKVLAAILDFFTIFIAGGYGIARLTGGLTEGGFSISGGPFFLLLAVVVAYFVILSKFLGGTLWQRVLGTR